ncbi:MAG: hypothetical protein ACD_3C00226G0008 [uncultured bacterium (gcode 4)]|uniref:Esterase n=1 Tax=uncultured bacterium (gcode 4) TaxID=1234023 RepID=K2GAU1_9BACT|nr:MAG: hypothetical protein ACD_3C00226G0008 [uncultured bacterium (gcode 4)]
MKNCIIIHWTGSNSESFWHPWLKYELEKIWYNVWLPDIPNAELPELSEWLPFILKNWHFNSETVLVWHSAWVPTILSVLENIDVMIKKSILIAGFIEPLNNEPNPILQNEYNWAKIKESCSEFIIINSDNDPWGCDDKKGKKIADNLDWTFIIKHDWHMWSISFNQPYKEFPELLKYIN